MENENGVCPLLGLVDEQGAYLTYPSYENRCYASRTPQSIPLNEQTFFCLGGHQERCPRFQSRQARMQADEPAAPAAAAAGATRNDDMLSWDTGGDDASQGSVDDYGWESQAVDDPWTQPAFDAAPPPPPLLPGTPADGRSRPPVWPLLLAAGTLVAVLMLCGLASAGWLGWQALSSQLALQPSATPLVEAGSTPVPGAGMPGGVVVVVATPTPQPLEATATAEMAATATAQALAAATPTPTDPFVFEPLPTEPPFFEEPTATPTWTPFVIFETPTPRDTPTFFPTNTPFVDPATATPTWTPFPLATASPTLEPFSASFVANPTSIQYGQSATLTWNVRGIRDMWLNGEAISGPAGTRVVTPLTTTTYVLRMLMVDNTVREETQTVTVSQPTPTNTPTITPTPTATPFINMVFAQDLSLTSISGQDASCRTGNGCTLFQVQVRNVGNRPAEYQLAKTEDIPIGWGVFFCWGGDCEFGNAPPSRTLAPGARDTISINYRVPSVLFDGNVATVDVTGTCPACPRPPFVPYANTFTVRVILPTPTPLPTATNTPTVVRGN